MSTRLTIRDIARLAGVSKSTVSRVLNQSNSVDAETRERVLRVMNEQRFVPSINATGLRGRSQLIGMLVPALTWPLILHLMAGVAEVIERTPYEIILYCSPFNKDYQRTIDRIVATKLTAGLLAMPHTHPPAHLLELHEQGLPVVLLNTTGLRVNIPRIDVDSYGGAYTAVRHLISLGHTRIGYMHGPPDFPCSQERYQGYCAALQEAGITPDPALFQVGHFIETGGAECARIFFAMDNPPTAIFASNDAMAYGLLEVASEQGIRVPQDVAVVGFDDYAPAVRTQPALTTIHQPFQDMGRCAAELLLSMLEPQYTFPDHWKAFIVDPPTIHTEPEEHIGPALHIQFPTHLVVRESCGAAQRIAT
jgi:LacI family transcriptional regulator